MQEVQEKNQASLESDAAELESFILQLSWVSHRRFEQELENFHLTVPQYIALNCVRQSQQGPERSSTSMSALAESAHQVSATMTGIVDRLLDRGLVVRERDPNDRRTLRIGLTQAGEDLLERVQGRKRAWLLQFLAALSPEERRVMIDMARRYLAVVEESFNPA